MRGKKIVFTIFGFLLVGGILLLSSLLQQSKPVYADTECPKGMNLLECYSYYEKERIRLEGKQNSTQQKLKEEEYQQLSLYEKIEYTQKQISETTIQIQTLQAQISAEDISIRILEQDIQEKEDHISTLRQEIVVLSDTVNQRVTEAYKYSFLDSIAIFLDFQNAPAILRKIKYLEITREQDKAVLGEHTEKTSILEKEEERLKEEKEKLVTKKMEIEEEKAKFAEAKDELDKQKAGQASLLAESKRRENLYLAEMKAISTQLNSTTAATAELMARIDEAGLITSGRNVAKGEVIGYQGHTGCSAGSHLHYQIRKGNSILNPVNYLGNTAYNSIVTHGAYHSPLSSALVTQDYNSGHLALDLVSKAEGNQRGQQYTIPYGLCSVVDSILNCRRYGYGYCGNKNQAPIANWDKGYLNGEGAPVRASTTGQVAYCYDQYGATWARVRQTDGNTTWYVHLQSVSASAYDCSCYQGNKANVPHCR